jgi:hypothetical protein
MHVIADESFPPVTVFGTVNSPVFESVLRLT